MIVKYDELESAGLRLLATIIIRGPDDFFEENLETFLQKRLRALANVKKRKSNLEGILSIVRGHSIDYVVAWQPIVDPFLFKSERSNHNLATLHINSNVALDNFIAKKTLRLMSMTNVNAFVFNYVLDLRYTPIAQQYHRKMLPRLHSIAQSLFKRPFNLKFQDVDLLAEIMHHLLSYSINSFWNSYVVPLSQEKGAIQVIMLVKVFEALLEQPRGYSVWDTKTPVDNISNKEDQFIFSDKTSRLDFEESIIHANNESKSKNSGKYVGEFYLGSNDRRINFPHPDSVHSGSSREEHSDEAKEFSKLVDNLERESARKILRTDVESSLAGLLKSILPMFSEQNSSTSIPFLIHQQGFLPTSMFYGTYFEQSSLPFPTVDKRAAKLAENLSRYHETISKTPEQRELELQEKQKVADKLVRGWYADTGIAFGVDNDFDITKSEGVQQTSKKKKTSSGQKKLTEKLDQLELLKESIRAIVFVANQILVQNEFRNILIRFIIHEDEDISLGISFLLQHVVLEFPSLRSSICQVIF